MYCSIPGRHNKCRVPFCNILYETRDNLVFRKTLRFIQPSYTCADHSYVPSYVYVSIITSLVSRKIARLGMQLTFRWWEQGWFYNAMEL